MNGKIIGMTTGCVGGAEARTEKAVTMTAGRTAVIIGGGMGGLITGAMLSRLGWRVTVLERNRNVGGGLQTFRRGGVDFCPGMHLVGGSDGGAAVALLRRLGVDVRLESCPQTVLLSSAGVFPEAGAGAFQEAGAGVFPETLSCARTAAERGSGAFAEYRIPQGVEAFYSYFAERFPESSAELRRYLDRMQEIYDSVPLLKLGSSDSEFSEGDDLTSIFSDGRVISYVPDGDALMPADEFVAKYISDNRLRTVLGWLNPLTGAIPGITPAYVHAIINILYISGSSRFAGGTKPIVERLVGIIEGAGGAVKAGCAATEILVGQDGSGDSSQESQSAPLACRSASPAGQSAVCGGTGAGRRKITGVRCSDGNVYAADIYISDIHPSALAALCPPDAFPKAFRRRLAAQKPGISLFSLYIKLRDAVAPGGMKLADGAAADEMNLAADGRSADASGAAEFILEGDSGSAWRPWGEIMYFRDGNALTVMAPMSCDEVAGWKGTAPGRRPKEYRQWIAERTERLLSRIERLEPGFRSRIETCLPASPLTLGDYLGDPDGAAYGFRIDSSAPSFSRFGPKTYLDNLYMTGQNAGLHGLCGVSMTSILTVNAICAEADASQMVKRKADYIVNDL